MTEVVIAQRGQKLKMAVIFLTFLSVGQRVALHPSGDGLLRRRRQPGPPLRALRSGGDGSGAHHWAAEGGRHDEHLCLEACATQLMSAIIGNSDIVRNVDTVLPILDRAGDICNAHGVCHAGRTRFRGPAVTIWWRG